MLTLFSTPKAFRGKFDLIQRNAIRSWTLLHPKPDILLLGDDPGTAEVAAEFGVRHLPTLEKNEYGTPLVSSLFETAEAAAANRLLCYINADIILTSDFLPAVRQIAAHEGSAPFLGVGRKTSVEIASPLPFHESGWESALTMRARSEGEFVTTDSDFFLFPKGTFRKIPPFAVGRCFWSPWFVFDARRRGLPVVDMTADVTTIESKHDYSHAKSTGFAKRLSGVEFEANRRLFRGCSYFTTVDASHVLAKSRIAPSPATYKVKSALVRSHYAAYFLLKGRLYPYSVPVLAALRLVQGTVQRLYYPFMYEANRGHKRQSSSEGLREDK